MTASFPNSLKTFPALADGVDDILAKHQNERGDEITAIQQQLFRTLFAGYNTNTETISATRVLLDSDKPIQILTPSAANRDVILPASAAGNHAYSIGNPSGASFNLVVKEGANTLATLKPGCDQVFIPTATGWRMPGLTISEADGSPRIRISELVFPNGTLSGSNGTATFSPFQPDYISGLKLEWNSISQITVGVGAAHIQSTGEVLRVMSPIVVNYSSSSMVHYYLYNNSGTPAVEASLTAPDSPYFGTARSKTGDTSRRYIGSVPALNISGTPTLLNFLMVGNRVLFRVSSTAEGRVANNLNVTTETAVSCSTLVPVSARAVVVRISNSATSGIACTGTSDDSVAGSGAAGITFTPPSRIIVTDHPLNTNQEFTFWYLTPPTGSSFAYIDVYGFILER